MTFAPHEDRHAFAVWSPNMATAVMAINRTGSAGLLTHIVSANESVSGGYWLVFKDDSWVKQTWRAHFPDAVTLPRDDDKPPQDR